MVADKTSLVPARTPTLLNRLLSGATLFAEEERRRNSGAVLGALSALGAAYAGERLRVTGARKGIPDPILSICEDRFVITIGACLLRR